MITLNEREINKFIKEKCKLASIVRQPVVIPSKDGIYDVVQGIDSEYVNFYVLFNKLRRYYEICIGCYDVARTPANTGEALCIIYACGVVDRKDKKKLMRIYNAIINLYGLSTPIITEPNELFVSNLEKVIYPLQMYKTPELIKEDFENFFASYGGLLIKPPTYEDDPLHRNRTNIRDLNGKICLTITFNEEDMESEGTLFFPK